MSIMSKDQQTDCYDRTSRFTYSQANWRQTIWPATDIEGNVFALGTPIRVNSFREQNKRWTGAFDPEARASRMSMLAGNSLFPPPLRPHDQHERWTGSNAQPQRNWAGSTIRETNIPESVWSDDSDDEKGSYWASWKNTQDDEENGDVDGGKGDIVEVGWMEDDAENPLNFPSRRKWLNAMVLALAVFMVSIASSGFSQGESGPICREL